MAFLYSCYNCVSVVPRILHIKPAIDSYEGVLIRP